MTWVWDESLYAGSARYYAVGRVAYPVEIAEALRSELGLDGTGRLLDVGCGPGALTLLLKPLFESVVAVDADRGMIEEARRSDSDVDWRCLRAEELPAGLGTFDVVTFAQSFHWMDQPLVAQRVRGMLAPGGWWVHVAATNHEGIAGDTPWDEIRDLIARYLGSVRRAGQGTLPSGETAGGEEDVMRVAGYGGPRRVTIERGDLVVRSVDEIVATVFSLSGSAPHLFGDRVGDFERDLRALLGAGPFQERMGSVALVLWSAPE